MASVDLTDPQSLNLYTYARNNPIDFTDPTGLLTIGIISCVRVCVEYDGKEDCEYQCDWEYISVGPTRDFQPITPMPDEEDLLGGGLGLQDVYPGGDYNKVAQLTPCLKLNVPGFGELQAAPRTLLESTFVEEAAEAYGSFTTYQKAVFVNTTVAAAYVGTDFSSAKFKDFYRADYGYENGLYVDGLKGTRRGRKKIGSSSDTASVEFEDDHIDVDLFHPNKGLLGILGAIILGKGGPSRHWGEVSFNKRYRRGTHPGDVEKRLAEEANINTGVSCKRK